MNKTTLWTGLMVALTCAAGSAGADPVMRSDRARRAGILAVVEPATAVHAPRPHAAEVSARKAEADFAVRVDDTMAVGRGGCRPGEACAALGTVPYGLPVLRSVGACDAESVELLASAIGRAAAIETCTGHGDPSAVDRALTHAPPRSSVATLPRPDVDTTDPLKGIEIDL